MAQDVQPTAETAKTGIGARPACFNSTLQEVLFVTMATLAMATNSFLTGVTMIITASIGKDLGMTQSQITWISAAPALTAGAFQLALGQLSDLLGRKAMLVAGLGSFSAGCVVVGFAQDPFWMDVVCGALGVFSAAVVPPAIGILGAAYRAPSRRKNWAFACFSAGNPLGWAMGSLTCGLAVRLFDWRAAFFLLAIVWALMAVAAVWVVPGGVEAFEPAPLKKRLGLLLRRFDSLGTLLIVLGVGLFTASLTLGPSVGWTSATVLSMLIIGALLLVAFVFWEAYWPDPLMPLHVWKDRSFTLLVATAVLGFMSFSATNFWLSYMLQKVRHYQPLDVAVHMLPQVIAGITWNVVAANILHRINNTFITAVGMLAFLVGSLLLSLQTKSSSYWALAFPSLVITVIGADFQFNVTNMYVMQALPPHQQSLAGGIFNMLLRLGTATSLGISTAVFSSLEDSPTGKSNVMWPYQRAFDVSIGLAGAGCLLVPFLRIGTQGNEVANRDDDGKTSLPLDIIRQSLTADAKVSIDQERTDGEGPEAKSTGMEI